MPRSPTTRLSMLANEVGCSGSASWYGISRSSCSSALSLALRGRRGSTKRASSAYTWSLCVAASIIFDVMPARVSVVASALAGVCVEYTWDSTSSGGGDSEDQGAVALGLSRVSSSALTEKGGRGVASYASREVTVKRAEEESHSCTTAVFSERRAVAGPRAPGALWLCSTRPVTASTSMMCAAVRSSLGSGWPGARPDTTTSVLGFR
mmetsp:Transcript_3007/g.7446  ORF Transcript_3007/g.7446 Transcript_3007/m.7446 type:complete len:208 (+) Transcript_3007:296-919(+)